jgi:hypothetical protein
LLVASKSFETLGFALPPKEDEVALCIGVHMHTLKIVRINKSPLDKVKVTPLYDLTTPEKTQEHQLEEDHYK